MRKIHLSAVCIAALALAGQSQAAAFGTVDQSNAVGGSGFGSGVNVTGLGQIGQSFTPTLNAIDAVELNLRSAGTSQATVTLFDGFGYGGSVLGTSSLSVTGTSFATYHFDFASTAALTPGSTYTLRVTSASGDLLYSDYSDTNVYAGGQMVEQAGFELVFAEGVHVPEPGSLALLGLGGLLVARRRR